jgi:hypothetical protein
MIKRKRTKYLQNITQKTKDRAMRSPLKTGSEHRYSERVSSSCSTCDNRRIVNPLISHEWRKDRKVIMTNETYPFGVICWSHEHIKHENDVITWLQFSLHMIGLKLIKRFWVLAISPYRLKIDPGRCPESDITLARHKNRWKKTDICYPIKFVLSLFNNQWDCV